MVNSKRVSIEPKPQDNFVEMSVTDPVEKGGVLRDPEADYSGAVKKTDPQEIRLVRKLDFRIMPTLWAMYFLNYVCLYSLQLIQIQSSSNTSQLDRNAIAQARLNGLEEHLGLVGTQYNTCISILFVG